MTCPSCESRFEKGDLIWPLPSDYIEGLLPGDELPLGLCPDCEEPVFEEEEEDEEEL